MAFFVVKEDGPLAYREELNAAYERINELETTLNEARLQIEYLHDKFQPTGTSESVLGRIYAVLS